MKPKFRSRLFTNSSLPAILVMSFAISSIASASTWVGDSSQDWNTAANWDSDPLDPTGNFTINNTVQVAPYPVLGADSLFSPVDVIVGVGATGRFDQTAGILSTGNGNWMIIGRATGGNGTFNLADTSGSGGTLTGFAAGTGNVNVGGASTTGGRLIVGDANNSVGTVNMNTSGTLKTEIDDIGMLLGNGGTTTGNFNLDGGIVQVNSLATNIGVLFGTNGGDGNFKMSGGQVNVTGGVWLGDNSANSQGLLEINGGTFTATSSSTGNAAGQAFIGRGLGQGTLTVGGTGIANFTGIMKVGAANTATVGTSGTVNVTGGTFTNTGEMQVGSAFITNGAAINATGAFNVSGGTATVNGSLLFARGNDNGDLVTGTGTVSGGVLNVENDLVVAYAGNNNLGQLTISGGVVNVGTTTKRSVKVNQWDTSRGQLTVSGGTLNLNTNTDLRFCDGNAASVGASIATLSSGAITSYSGNQTGSTTTGQLDMNVAGGATSNNTFNLNGGVLTIQRVISTSDNGTAAFNFHGGTLKASNASTTFVSLGGANQKAFVKSGGAIVDSNGFDVTIGEALLTDAVSTGGGLTKQGIGTLTLTGASTYTGPTLVSNGTLALTGTGSINSTSGVTINGAAAKYVRTSSVAGTVPILLTLGTLDGTGSTGAVTVADNAANILANGNGGTGALTANALTFQGDATVNASYGGSTPIVVTGALTTTPANGQVTINVPSTLLNGTHNLIQFGSFGGSASDFTLNLSGLNSRQSAGAPTISGNNLAVTVSGDVPVWTGVNGQGWTTANNWATKTGLASTSFLVGDLVEFNDTYNLGAGNVAVTQDYVEIATSVSPGTTIFNNNSVSYTIDSLGDGIATGTLTKNGAATTTLVGSHTYTGATTINGGTLKLGDDTSDGSIDNTASVTNNGTLLYYNLLPSAAAYPISGTGSLVKQQPGTLTLTGTNSYSGGTTVSAGKLVAPSNSLNAGPISIASNAIMTFTGNGQTSSSTVTGLGDIVNDTANTVVFTGDHSGFSGTFTHNAAANNTQFNSAVSGSQNASYSLLDGEIILAANGDYTVKFGDLSSNAGETIRGGNTATGTATLEVGNLGTNTTIAGNLNNGATKVLALTKVGGGTLTLAGTNTYSGATAISSGTLSVTGTSTASPVLVNAGTTLDGTGSVGTVNVVDNATATITNGAGGSSKLTLASLIFAGDAKVIANKAAPTITGLAVTGAVGTTPANGTVTIDCSSPGWIVNADNNLITYGSFGGAIGNFTKGTVSGTNSRMTGSSLVNTGSAIALNVTGDSIVWSGASSGTWTTAADGNSAGPNNWATKAGLAGSNFWTYDNVEFNDTYNVGGGAVAVTQNAVNISGGDVSPAITTFNNSIVNYTIGSGDASKIAAGSLVKNGTGSVTFNTANTYAGGTAINNGSIILGDASALGSGSVALNGGALNLNGLTAANPVVLGGGTVTGTGTLSGVVSGSSLTKSDASTLILTNTNTFNGGLNITAGAVSVARQVNLGAVGNDITLNGGTLRTTSISFADWGADFTRDLIVGAGGGTLNNLGDRLVFWSGASGTLTGTGNLTVTGDGVLHGNSGVGVLVLVGAYTGFTGNLILDQGGTVELDNATPISAGSTLVLQNNSQVTVANGKTVSNPITVNGTNSVIAFNNSGTGVVAGNVTLNSDVTVALRDWYNYATSRSGTISGVISGSGDLTTSRGTSTGTPTLTLSGINTYTGDTNVVDGTTVVLADNGGLKFVVGGVGVNNKVTGSGTATMSGDFTFDLSGANLTNGNQWTIVDATNKSFGASFTVVGFDDADLDDVWTMTSGSNTWTFTEATGVLSLSVTAGSGYGSWAATNAPSGTADDDFDNDGVSNGVEYVLGGLATTNDSGKLPAVSTTGGNLIFTFLRDQDSETPDTAVKIEVGTTLAAWPTSYAVPNDPVVANPGVTVVDNGNGTDTITLTIPQAPDAKKFARLVVTVQ